jgi:hypothetical protein
LDEHRFEPPVSPLGRLDCADRDLRTHRWEFLQCGGLAFAANAPARRHSKLVYQEGEFDVATLSLPALLASTAPTAFGPRLELHVAQRAVRRLRTKNIAQILGNRALGLFVVDVLCRQISTA